MPLVYQHNINAATKLAVWQITEPDSFFLARVPLKKDVSHPHKRLQHLAGRFLLPLLFHDFPLEDIQIADTRKPFLENEHYHFSISHCGNYAAAIVSKTERVGIDIEMITPKIERVQHKFANPEELRFFNDYAKQGWQHNGNPEHFYTAFLTLLWSAKESVFKWYGLGMMDFKKHMQLHAPMVAEKDGLLQIPFILNKQGFRAFDVHAKLFEGMALAWLHTV